MRTKSRTQRHLLHACVMFGLVLPGAAIPVSAQQSFSAPAAEREAVRQAILDYVEGIYEVAPERIERSVHPTLAKRGYQVPKDSVRYREGSMTYERLLEVARNFNRTRWVPASAPKRIEIFEVLDQTASAKLTAVWGIDYFHLAKYDGRWKIVNVIWQSPPEEHPLFKGAAEATDDLAALNDEFDRPDRLGDWKLHHVIE